MIRGYVTRGIGRDRLAVVTLYIETYKDNSIQEWLMRSHFGNRPDKYKTHTEEAEQFKRALA